MAVEPQTIRYTRVGFGRAYHALSRYTKGKRSVVVCGAPGGPAGEPIDDDSRAIRLSEGPVCDNCRRLLDTGGVEPMLTSPTTARRPGAQKGAPMPNDKKAKSRELLDIKTYAKQSDKRLREERSTINNRLSGVATQLAREPKGRMRELRDRQKDLIQRRDAINSELATRTAQEPATSNGNEKLATATKQAGKELAKVSSKTTRSRKS